MVNISELDLESLYRQGAQGSAAGFALVGRQVVSRLKKTDPELAGKLAGLLAPDAGTRLAPGSASPVDADSRRSLLREESHVFFEHEPQWAEPIKKLLSDVILERQKYKDLVEAGLEPIKSLIFTGPPGVGKTLAAKWLASKLNMPILTLDLASVMSSLLGKTGANIKSVIEYAKKSPCVLLLDEFDAIAKRRDDEKDVGELKRLVNVLLQAIDEWPASSVLIAATNHPDMLDPAVWRRFELSLKFNAVPLPIVESLFKQAGVDGRLAGSLSSYLEGKSYSDINRLLVSAKKKSVLTARSINDTAVEVVAVDAANGSVSQQSLRDIQILSLSLRGFSQRHIASELGLTHPTVGKVIKGFKEGYGE